MLKSAWFAGVMALLAIVARPAEGAPISAQAYADHLAFELAIGGLTSLTGPLPSLGNVGTSTTLGDATLVAANSIIVNDDWSSLIVGNEIAVSGAENLTVNLNDGPRTAFGFYFHEPMTPNVVRDGCNWPTCVDSTFTVSLYLGGNFVDSALFAPANDALVFWGIVLGSPFDEVRFVEAAAATSTSGLNDNVDNEFFGEMYVNASPVPEPGTVLLLSAGLLACAYRVRRRLLE